ncbi:MAG: DUF5130 domain-containing protein [Actinomycetota bacterium]|nr:DUF5130 domain-containing protein [Actinomycetota bacterium]
MTTAAELDVMKDGTLPAAVDDQGLERWTPPTVGPRGNADSPFVPSQRNTLDEVMAAAERSTGLRFSVYLGDLGTNSQITAESLHAGLGVEAVVAVLLAVSPAQRIVEVVTGAEAARRISNRSARLAVLSVIASCSEGDLLGSLVNGVRTLADQAGTLPERSNW